MLALKLLLVATSVLLSTLASRRFGHAVGGAVAGMPMIAAPIMAILLIDHDPLQVRAIALATLACVPATILHIVTFAKAAPRATWPVALAAALVAFFIASVPLTQLPLPPLLVCAVALAAPSVGLWVIARQPHARTPVHVPHAELVLRIVVAVAMAAAIILGAGTLPVALSGIMLAVPITGNVLPCFTLPRYGAAATVSLMTGFLQGLHGFTVFMIALYWTLGVVHPAAAFGIALAAALAMAVGVQAAARMVRRTGLA